jgi:hypothetical protein
VLFEEAVKAKLPIVTVTTRDLMNFKDVVQFLTKRPLLKYDSGDVKKDTLRYYISDKPLQYPDKEYAKFAGVGSTLLVVNPPRRLAEAFDVGELFVPIALVRRTLSEAYKADEDPQMAQFVDSLLPTLGGLTLKEVGEVIRLAEVRFDEVSPAAVTRTRAALVPDLQGFSAISTTMDGPYLPNEDLLEFAEEHKRLFLDPETDQRLVPKGLLAKGLPGTGKTQGTKWLADFWGVPLYRLDASLLNKYYGESENNLKVIFGKVANEAPCILLIDEAEKLLGISRGEGGDNMMSRIRGMLLWQMQESRDRVFYMLTTNDAEALPPELIREGRIDRALTFEGLLEDEAKEFAVVIMKSFLPKHDKQVILELEARLNGLFTATEGDRVSHAAVTAAVKSVVKLAIKKGGKE